MQLSWTHVGLLDGHSDGLSRKRRVGTGSLAHADRLGEWDDVDGHVRLHEDGYAVCIP